MSNFIPNLGLTEPPLKGILEEYKSLNEIVLNVVGIGKCLELMDLAQHTIPTGPIHSLRPIVIHKLYRCECDVCGKKFNFSDTIIFRCKIAYNILILQNFSIPD